MEKKSMKEVQEFKENQFTKRILIKKGDTTVFILNFLPGQELPKHKHPGAELYLLVLDGSGTTTVDGKKETVMKNDVFFVSGESEFSFANTGNEPTVLYVVLNNTPNENYARDI